MAKNPRQKQKLLYLQKILLEKTDENHGITVNEIIEELDQYGISAERKSIYNDLEILQTYGLDICSEKSKTVKYFIGSRDFQISELKLLVDAVQSSKFMTEDKSLQLIKKLESLASIHEARLLRREVYIANRVKTGNETIYYNVNDIHEAINTDRIIEFFYTGWELNIGGIPKVKLARRRSGEVYRVSPWKLCWDDENYYLIAYDELREEIRHYRVDKMEKIRVTETPRNGREVFDKFDVASYTKATFAMYSGTFTDVTLSVHNSLIGVIVDRFGKSVFITEDKNNPDRFILKTTVNLSEQFFGWLFALGDKIRIISPTDAIEKYKAQLRNVSNLYNKEGTE